MKVQVSELKGAQLNYAVRYALSGTPPKDYIPNRDNFSSCWNKAGPIIFNERIAITPCFDTVENKEMWLASMPYISHYKMKGETPEIAAMRRFVGWKLGSEVEIPDFIQQLMIEEESLN